MFRIWGMQSVDSKTFGSNMSVAADGSLVFDFGEAVTFENSNVASPKSLETFAASYSGNNNTLRMATFPVP